MVGEGLRAGAEASERSEDAREGATVAEIAARMTVEAVAARSGGAARALRCFTTAGLVWFTPPARIADCVCDDTGAARAKREAAITGSRAYGLMLPPGLFQPSHSSTLDNAGCLARYPPVRV